MYLNNIRNKEVTLPNATVSRVDDSYLDNVWHLFVIRTRNRNKLQKYLLKNGVRTLIHYPIPPHKQAAYKEFSAFQLPITEKIHNEILSLPISQVITNKQAHKIADLVNGIKFL